DLEKELELEKPITVEGAIKEYEKWRRDVRGLRESSTHTTMRHLRSLLDTHLQKGRVVQLSPVCCEAAYQELAKTTSADYHRNAAGEAKTWGKGCVKQGSLRRTRWEEVERVGRRRGGKPQPRVDEARKWLDTATTMAKAGDDGAVAAMMTLVLG